jgi:hypothetical protein
LDSGGRQPARFSLPDNLLTDVWSFTTEEGGCVIPDGGDSGGCNAAGLGLISLALFAPLGLLLRKIG